MNSLVSHLICVLVCILCLPHGGGFCFLVLQLVLFGRVKSSKRVIVSRAHVMSFNTQGPARPGSPFVFTLSSFYQFFLCPKLKFVVCAKLKAFFEAPAQSLISVRTANNCRFP